MFYRLKIKFAKTLGAKVLHSSSSSTVPKFSGLRAEGYQNCYNNLS